MPTSGILVNQLSEIISQAVAPAFLLGAMAGLMSVLVGRFNRIVDRCKNLTAIHDDDPTRGRVKADVAHLMRRARLINRAIECAVVSGIFTACLVLVAFAAAFLGTNHAYGAAVLFMLALASFTLSLIYLWLEVRMALRDLDYSG